MGYYPTFTTMCEHITFLDICFEITCKFNSAKLCNANVSQLFYSEHTTYFKTVPYLFPSFYLKIIYPDLVGDFIYPSQRPRIAPQNSPHRKHRTHKKSVFLISRQRIGRTSRIIFALRRQRRTYKFPVCLDRQSCQPCKGRHIFPLPFFLIPGFFKSPVLRGFFHLTE